MFNKRVIVLCGRGQSGKSTAARLLVEQDPVNVERMAFADPLKHMLMAMGVPGQHLYGSNEDKNEKLAILEGHSARHAMQTLGTEWRDTLGKSLWVHNLAMRIQASGTNCIVVEDMRFQHEYEYFKEQGALIIGIERPGQGTSNDTHASETWDFKATGMPVIKNDGSINDLQLKLWSHT